MVWRYKIVEFFEGEYKETNGQIQSLRKSSEKKAGEIFRKNNPDWDEKEKILSEVDKDEFLEKEYYQPRYALFRKKAMKEFSYIEFTDFSAILPNKDFTFTFPLYLQMIINFHASEGWELDKIRNSRTSEQSGYLVFRKQE